MDNERETKPHRRVQTRSILRDGTTSRDDLGTTCQHETMPTQTSPYAIPSLGPRNADKRGKYSRKGRNKMNPSKQTEHLWCPLARTALPNTFALIKNTPRVTGLTHNYYAPKQKQTWRQQRSFTKLNAETPCKTRKRPWDARKHKN